MHKNSIEAYFTEINFAETEAQHMLDHLDEYMAPEKVATDILNVPGWSRIYRDPRGVALIMAPWNYPVNLAFMPVAGAIAAGCCVMLKVPSPKYTAETSKVMADLVREYLDPACVMVAEGGREITGPLLEERWDVIFFTGGCFVGRLVAAAAAKHLTPCVLELGGKSPCIVDASADLGIASKRISWGAFMNAGQTCVRPDYLCVHERVADAFLARMRAQSKACYSENAQDSEWFGRVINARAHARVAAIVDDAQRSGHVAMGGRTDASDNYVEPTILDFGSDWDAFRASKAMEDEIFGPVLPMIRYGSLDDVIAHVCDGEKPLSLYCFTTNGGVRNRVLTETSSGSVNINDVIMHMSNHLLPFGGVGQSGMGAYHGKRTFDCFTHSKAVLIKTNYLDIPSRYPPYNGFDVQLLEWVQYPYPAWQLRIAKYVGLLLLLLWARSKLPTKQEFKMKMMLWAMKFMQRRNS